MNHNNDATVGFNGDGAEPYEGRTAGAQGAPDEPVAVVGGGIGLNGMFHLWGNEVMSGAVSQEISKILIVRLGFVMMDSTAVPRRFQNRPLYDLAK